MNNKQIIETALKEIPNVISGYGQGNTGYERAEIIKTMDKIFLKALDYALDGEDKNGERQKEILDKIVPGKYRKILLYICDELKKYIQPNIKL